MDGTMVKSSRTSHNTNTPWKSSVIMCVLTNPTSMNPSRDRVCLLTIRYMYMTTGNSGGDFLLGYYLGFHGIY